MACALVLPHQWAVLDVANVVGIHVWNLQKVGKLVESGLINLSFIDNDGVVHVSTFDEVGLQQWHDVAHEDECASSSYLCWEIFHVVESSKLTVDELAVERTHCSYTELLIWQNGDNRTCFLWRMI